VITCYSNHITLALALALASLRTAW
jgi:hypothetical protein